MTPDDREIQRKLKIIKHAEETGHIGRTWRYFGIGRASFYCWKAAVERQSEASLVRMKPTPKNPKNRIPPEIVEKVLRLRKTYHLGPIGDCRNRHGWQWRDGYAGYGGDCAE